MSTVFIGLMSGTSLDGMDAALPWVWGALVVMLLGAAGLIFWLVRRSRRVHVPK